MDYEADKDRQREWRAENSGAQKDPNYEVSEDMWNAVTENEEDISYMFDDEATPVKAVGDMAYEVGHSGNLEKEDLECRETFSQMKRRRMLQFTNDDMDSTLCTEEMSSMFLKSNENIDSIEDDLPGASDWVSGFAESSSVSMFDTLDASSEWIRDCLNDTEIHLNHDSLNQPGASHLPSDLTEYSENAPVFENNAPQQPISTPRKIVFRGRKSNIRPPTKLPSSVAYPFAFIKPSGARGDVTLKDINKKIRTPPPQKPDQKSEDPNISYPTSAFSGKPVVGKTKIHTDGGKGSITIMRTKG